MERSGVKRGEERRKKRGGRNMAFISVSSIYRYPGCVVDNGIK